MKSDLINWMLTLVLGVLAVATVILAVRTANLMHEFRMLSTQAAVANNSLLQARALANDVGLYNQKSPSPELTRILTAVQGRPAAH
jgi:hypothetical protein